MRDEPAATKLLVVFAFFRTFVGFVHDIAPSAQRFGDAGKPCFFGGRKTVHMVTDFVEHIMMLSTRSSESETSVVELTTVVLEST
jgi:hypothetical protein